MGNEATKEIGAASDRRVPEKVFARMAGRHFDYVFAAQTVSADRAASGRQLQPGRRLAITGISHASEPALSSAFAGGALPVKAARYSASSSGVPNSARRRPAGGSRLRLLGFHGETFDKLDVNYKVQCSARY